MSLAASPDIRAFAQDFARGRGDEGDGAADQPDFGGTCHRDLGIGLVFGVVGAPFGGVEHVVDRDRLRVLVGLIERLDLLGLEGELLFLGKNDRHQLGVGVQGDPLFCGGVVGERFGGDLSRLREIGNLLGAERPAGLGFSRVADVEFLRGHGSGGWEAGGGAARVFSGEVRIGAHRVFVQPRPTRKTGRGVSPKRPRTPEP